VFEKRLLGRIFGPKREEVARGGEDEMGGQVARIGEIRREIQKKKIVRKT
jgi:hypothetical protein